MLILKENSERALAYVINAALLGPLFCPSVCDALHSCEYTDRTNRKALHYIK